MSKTPDNFSELVLSLLDTYDLIGHKVIQTTASTRFEYLNNVANRALRSAHTQMLVDNMGVYDFVPGTTPHPLRGQVDVWYQMNNRDAFHRLHSIVQVIGMRSR